MLYNIIYSRIFYIILFMSCDHVNCDCDIYNHPVIDMMPLLHLVTSYHILNLSLKLKEKRRKLKIN